MTHLRRIVRRVFYCAVIAACMSLPTPALAVTATTTITSMNGESPTTANLSLSGEVLVGVRMTFSPAICDPTITVKLRTGMTIFDQYSVTVTGQVTQWDGTLRWNTRDYSFGDSGCRNSASLYIEGSASGHESQMGGTCNVPTNPSDNSDSVSVHVRNAGDGCGDCTGNETGSCGASGCNRGLVASISNGAISCSDFKAGSGSGINPTVVTFAHNTGRHYSAGPLGAFWAHTYDYNLTEVIQTSSLQYAKVRRGLSNEVSFKKNGANYDALSGSAGYSLVKNGDNTWTLTAPNQAKEYFDTAGKLTQMKDPPGNATNLAYDGNARLSKITSPANIDSFLYYDANGRITKFTDGASRNWTMAYNGSGRMTQLTTPDSSTWGYLYNANGYLTQSADGHGHTVGVVFDGNAWVTKLTDSMGNNTTLYYDGEGRLTKLTNPRNYNTTYAVDSLGQRTRITDAKNQATNFYYNSDGWLTKEKNPLNVSTEYYWDTKKNLTKLLWRGPDTMMGAGPELGNRQYLHDSSNRLTRAIDELSRKADYAYDSNHNITQMIQRDANDTALATTSYLYSSNGQRTQMTDPRAKVWKWLYNSSGDLTRTLDPLNNPTDYTWTSAGEMEIQTDALGHKTKYLYDTEHRITKVIYNFHLPSQDQATRLFYFDCCNKLSDVDENNNETRYFYDANHRLTNVRDALGNETQALYDAVGNTTRAKDALLNNTDFLFDEIDRLTKTIYPNTSVTELLYYNSVGSITRRTDARSNSTDLAYDDRQRLTKITYPDTKTTIVYYDSVGNHTRETNQLSKNTDQYFDGLNRITKITDALSNNTQFFYDANSNRTRVQDARSNNTDQYFDDANRLTKVTDPNSNSTLTSYDAAGNGTRIQNALSQNTDFKFDDRNRLTRTTDHLSNNTDSFYDKAGNRTRQKDANANNTDYAFNGLNRVTQTTNALSNTVKFYFNAVGSTTRVTNERGKNWDYLFDWAGRTTKMTQPDNTTEQLYFDGNGNLTRKTDGNSANTDYLYDSLNRLTKKDFPAGTTDVSFYFDDAGRRTKMTDDTGDTTYNFDDVGRLTRVTYPISLGKSVSSFFDSVGNRTKMTDPDSGNTTYDFDSANRLTRLTNPDSQVTTFLYDAINRATKQTNHNGTYATYAFDGASSLTQLENRKSDTSLLSSFGYLQDGVGNRTQVTENVAGSSSTVTFAYDATHRLTKEKRTTTHAIWYEYLYDAAHNRTKYIQKDQMGTETSSKGYAYDDANKLTLEGNLGTPGANGNIQYTWDSNGNLTKKNVVGDGFTEYRYDAGNHMTKLNNGVTLTYTYNGDGERFSKYDGSTTTKFVHDRTTGAPGLDSVLIETDSGGTTQARYTNEQGLISQKRGSTTSYYHFEGRGSARQLTGSTETVTDTYTFDAWGNELNSAQPTTSPFRYVGGNNYYTDSQSGIALLGARWYAPNVGRFNVQDPLGLLGGLNVYGYVNANPVSYIDATGLREPTEFDYQMIMILWQYSNNVPPANTMQATEDILQEILNIPTGKPDPANLQALYWGISQLGNPSYGEPGNLQPYPGVSGVSPGGNKCNRFVGDCYAMGAGVGYGGPDGYPTNTGWRGGRPYPPAANTLGNSNSLIQNFPVIPRPEVGAIVAFPMPEGLWDKYFGEGRPGHSALYVGGGLLIYAGPKDVKIDTFVRNQAGHNPAVYRQFASCHVVFTAWGPGPGSMAYPYRKCLNVPCSDVEALPGRCP